MDYVFGGIAYPTFDRMIEAVVTEWMTAGGLNDYDGIKALLATYTDMQLAKDCMGQWNIGSTVDLESIAKEFGEFRASVARRVEA